MAKKNFTMRIVDAISSAVSELEGLRDEVREVVDNASGTNFENTPRIQTLSETADILDNISEPDVPECVEDLMCSWVEDHHKRLSRRGRRDNATAALSAVLEQLEGWIGDDKNTEHEDHDSVVQLQTDVQEILDNAESADFPGMMG